MDSVSQIVLGASVAHLTLGSRLGRPALVLGAVLGTLPDLDVLIPYASAIENYTYHRGFSHSILVLTLISLPIAWLCQRLMRSKLISLSRWWLACWLVLVTHPLLDGFTIYGTQLLWPLTVTPTAWGSVFIIDPLYTLPLIVGVALAYRRSYAGAKPYVIAGLALSSAYLLWTLVAQHTIRERVVQQLKANDMDAQEVLIAPFPFALLWRVVVVNDSQYKEGFSSLLDDSGDIALDSYSHGKQECMTWLDHWPIARLDWFTSGVYALSVQDNQLVASDLRMGVEDDYVFEFEIADWVDGRWQAINTRLRPVDIDAARMTLLFHRIYDQHVDLSPISAAIRQVPPTCEPVNS